MRFLDSFRRVRVCGLRGAASVHAKNRQRNAVVALCGSAALLLAACSQGQEVSAPPPAFVRHGQELQVPADSPLRKRLVVAPVEIHAAPHWLDVPATVEADPARVAKVLPALGGRVLALHVDLGARVRRGQLLAVIDSGDMAQAWADAAKARSALDFARKTLAREKGVAAAGGAAVKDLEAAHSAYMQAQAEYERAQARVVALGGTPGANTPRPIDVRAPISGTVTALAITRGMFVNDPTASIMTITDIERVWVTAQVPGDQLGLVAVGQAAKVSVPAWPGRVFTGKVASIGAVLDPDTRRDPVRIAINNVSRALKPNMFANVALAVSQPPQVLVPASALLMNNDNTTVFVELAPWTFVRRNVTLGYDEGEDVRVLSGLAADARVIVAGAVLLNDD